MILPHLLTLFFIGLTTALILPLNLTHHHPLTLPSQSNPPTFRLLIARTVRHIQSLNPDARLTRIEGTSPHGPIQNPTPTAMTDISLFFSVAPHVSIRVLSRSHATRWCQWARPEVVPEERPESELGLGDVLTSDILQVVGLMEDAGYGAGFDALDVVREEGMTEVRWMFQMEGLEGSVWVGDESGEVDGEEGVRRDG